MPREPDPGGFLSGSDTPYRLLVESVQDYAMFLLDPHGIVVSWNDAAQRIKGWRADEIVGRSFTLFYPRSAIDSGWPEEELRRAREHGRFEDEGWRLRRDGSRFWANVVITAVRDREGLLRGFAKVTRDLTERRRHEEALRQSEERLRLLVEAVRDHAMFMLDVEGRVETWNAGARSITGHRDVDVVGQGFSMFYLPEDVAAGRPQQHLRHALAEGRYEGEGWRARRGGGTFWAHTTITPVFDTHGVLRGYAHVVRDMTQTRRLVELEHASRRMSEFIAMLAHELRNPLAPIRNAVSILQMQPHLEPAVRQCRDVIDRQLADLTRLVDDLLDVGRIVTGKILLRTRRVDFGDVVRRSVEAVRPAMQARRHRLSVALPAQRVDVIGDDTRLVQALQNVLSNAVRYTEPGGEVALAVRTEDGEVVTTVTDTGRGIAPEAVERIFELFMQEAEGAAPAEGGLGIGLPLARTLAQLHHGSLTAASRGLGQGSTFTLRLPLAPAAGAPAGDEGVVSSEGEPLFRVLVVDDNRDSADTMVSLLRLLGHEADVAYGAERALQVFGTFHPQVVLLDLNMPGASGFEVLRRLRTAPGGDLVHVAAMTGYGQQTDRASTLAAGFQAHLTKPVGVEQLQAMLREIRS